MAHRLIPIVSFSPKPNTSPSVDATHFAFHCVHPFFTLATLDPSSFEFPDPDAAILHLAAVTFQPDGPRRRHF